MKQLIFIIFLTFACNLFAQDASDRSIRVKSDSEKRIALVIGNSDYINSGKLSNPVNDAKAMKEVLEKLGFEVTEYENCDQKTMKKAIDDFGVKLKNYETGLFFYAGHGVQVSGNNYLIPIDADLTNENDVEYDCVRADRVLAKMESAEVKTNIIILDACRDNPFERSWRRGTKGSGLAFMDAPSGSLIAYATSPGKTASNGTEANGLYTFAILQHIKTPNITIEDMFKRVRTTVMKESDSRQIPWESVSLTGNFYFTENVTIGKDDHTQLEEERERIEKEWRELELKKALIEEKKKIEAERKRLEDEEKKILKDEYAKISTTEIIPDKQKNSKAVPGVMGNEWEKTYFKPCKAGTYNVIVKSLNVHDYSQAESALKVLLDKFPNLYFRLVNTVAKDGVSNQSFAIYMGNGLSSSEADYVVKIAKKEGVASDAYKVLQHWDVE